MTTGEELVLTYETCKDARGRPSQWHSQEMHCRTKFTAAEYVKTFMGDSEQYRNIKLRARLVQYSDWYEVDLSSVVKTT